MPWPITQCSRLGLEELGLLDSQSGALSVKPPHLHFIGKELLTINLIRSRDQKQILVNVFTPLETPWRVEVNFDIDVSVPTLRYYKHLPSFMPSCSKKNSSNQRIEIAHTRKGPKIANPWGFRTANHAFCQMTFIRVHKQSPDLSGEWESQKPKKHLKIAINI